MHRVGWGLAFSAALIAAALFVSKPQGDTLHPFLGSQTAGAAYFDEEDDNPYSQGGGSMPSYAYPVSDDDYPVVQMDTPTPQTNPYQGYYQQSPDDSDSPLQYTPSYYDTDPYGSGTGGGSQVNVYYDTGSPYTQDAAPSYGSGGGNTAPYYDEVVYQPLTTQKPWYEKLLPGVGTSLSSLLPPIFRQDPAPALPAPVQIAPQPAPVRPTCIISANPGVIARGQRASLAWGSQNAVRAQLSSGGTVAVRGGTSISPAQSTVYVLTVYGQSGLTGSCSASITVR